jgi:hypothetical protein
VEVDRMTGNQFVNYPEDVVTSVSLEQLDKTFVESKKKYEFD